MFRAQNPSAARRMSAQIARGTAMATALGRDGWEESDWTCIDGVRFWPVKVGKGGKERFEMLARAEGFVGVVGIVDLSRVIAKVSTIDHAQAASNILAEPDGSALSVSDVAAEISFRLVSRSNVPGAAARLTLKAGEKVSA